MIPPKTQKDKYKLLLIASFVFAVLISFALGGLVMQHNLATEMIENNIIFCDKDTGRSLAYEDNVKETILVIPNDSGILPLEVN
jgi:hypothetical protein